MWVGLLAADTHRSDCLTVFQQRGAVGCSAQRRMRSVRSMVPKCSVLQRAASNAALGHRALEDTADECPRHDVHRISGHARCQPIATSIMTTHIPNTQTLCLKGVMLRNCNMAAERHVSFNCLRSRFHSPSALRIGRSSSPSLEVTVLTCVVCAAVDGHGRQPRVPSVAAGCL